MYTPNKSGSAILIALVVLIILTIMSTVFLEKLLGFAKASEGIENSNVAYYHANGVIEEALYTGWVNKYTPWNISNITIGGPATSTGKSLRAMTGGSRIPSLGNGNSPYDKDWNILSLSEPIQLVIPGTMTNADDLSFYFRIPIVDLNQPSRTIDPNLSNTWLIMWTFTSTGLSLFASGSSSIFSGAEIDGNWKRLTTKNGIMSSWTLSTFWNFLSTYWSICGNYKCTLKLILLQPVWTIDNPNVKIPFLEYYINLGGGTELPQRFMRLEANGYAYGFMRTRIIDLPQITTSNALDFAVLQ